MQRLGYYIYEHPQWPDFYWDAEELLNLLSEARNLQGRLMGRMESLGFDLQNQAQLDALTLDVLKTSEIEGEKLHSGQVRSSVARKLGMEYAGMVDSDRHVDGVVEMMLDATRQCFEPLTAERLFDWHAALFPTGRSGMYKITVAYWRQDGAGPMQVVSGPMGKEKVHFQAPDCNKVPELMQQFLEWFNKQTALDPVMKAALAHFWFVTVHPFDDGNGRIARALADMLLARADQSNQRFYSMSAQIRKERKRYYAVLEKTQKGGLDITEWMHWFLSCLVNALKATDVTLQGVTDKANFWKYHANTELNDRQRKMVNKLLDGLHGKLSSSKWAKMTKCSRDTAIRDINDLLEKGVLQKEAAGGRSTHYELMKPV
jgi:Fic family protein